MPIPCLPTAALIAGLLSSPPKVPEPESANGSVFEGCELALYTGYHGIGEGVDSGELGLEFRLPPSFLDLQFSLGYMATTDEASMVYVGSRYALEYGGGFELGPSAAVGYYERGDGQDLGNELMFRIGADITRGYGDLEVGLGVFHYSNGGTGHPNPGLESVLLTVTYAL